ncbi:MAG: lipopolysaccharide heptosyltransferase II [Candidatus Omnitrophica bacterium]|nr:lipopolysaccharide heptosyltransferase II [Candidatus Omnitrophota bacterium]
MKILVIHPYGIGDCLFMTPLLKALKKQLSPECIDVIIGSRTQEILQNNPAINEIFVVDKDKWKKQGRIKTWIEKRKLYLRLKERRYDCLIDLSLRKEYGRWLAALRIPKRIGFNHRGRGKYLNYNLFLPPEGFQGMHVVEFYSQLGKFLGVKVEDKHLQYYIPLDAEKKAGEILNASGIENNEKIIAVVPGSGSSWGKDAYLKQWPIENFICLINKLGEDFYFDVVVILGTEEEEPIGERLKMGIKKKAINLMGKTDLNTSAAIIKRARLFLGNDGGMVHIARSQDIPLIAIYGPVDPDVYGPYPRSENAIALFKDNLKCRPCYRGFKYNKCLIHDCLKDFTVEEAYLQLQQKHFLKNLVI